MPFCKTGNTHFKNRSREKGRKMQLKGDFLFGILSGESKTSGIYRVDFVLSMGPFCRASILLIVT